MRSQRIGARDGEHALSAFLFGATIVFLAGLSSCSSPATSNNGTANTVTSTPTPTQTTTPELPTVTRLDQMNVGSAANFQAPNGKVFKVTFREAEPEFPVLPDGNTNAMPHGPGSHPCDGESFDGTDRKASKIKPSTAAVEDFENLSDFIDTLASDDDMGVNHTPAIGTGATSTRVTEEKRNVHIASAWLYTFSREGDEDFHVIIGTTNDKETATFFNAEISGLPGNSASAFAALNEARTTFKDFFGLTQCSSGYTADMMDEPQEIEITGSPFFDKLHFQGHGSIGPSYARSSSYWEIHPITEIVFK